MTNERLDVFCVTEGEDIKSQEVSVFVALHHRDSILLVAPAVVLHFIRFYTVTLTEQVISNCLTLPVFHTSYFLSC